MFQAIQNNAQEIGSATAATGTAVGTIAVMAQVNVFLQAAAFIVAIISGSLVIWSHFKKRKK